MRICEGCSQEFEPKNAKQKFCSLKCNRKSKLNEFYELKDQLNRCYFELNRLSSLLNRYTLRISNMKINTRAQTKNGVSVSQLRNFKNKRGVKYD